jgi:cytochrome bd-type quinol oxidase subunit 2
MDSDLKAVEDAEVRLQSRSLQRRAMIERRDRRRRLMPWLLCLVPLPLIGAAAMLAVLRSAGGDLREWPAATAALAVAACVVVPALASAWVGRRHGMVDAVLWALVTAAIVLALVFGAGFALLGLGP